VDDHQIILDGLAALINSESETMTVVGRTNDPERILALARELDPDVVLLDLDLGKNKAGVKVSGIDLLPQLAKESKAKVLILTGEQDIALHAEAISLGAKGVVIKNAPGDVIIQAVKKVAGGQRWHSDEILDYMMNGRQQKDLASNGQTDLDSDNIATLTPTQLRVITTVASNVTSTNSQIAKLLRISEHTLKNHLTEINSKLYTRNKMDLFMFAKKHNLDKIDP
jgi:DNA-binding NarL/FixJ family response regulator